MSDTDYTITFAPNQIGKMHVCNVKILSRGKHVCIDNEPIITFVSNPDNSTYDSASIQLGNIINWGPVGSTVQVDDNMVIISIIGVNFLIIWRNLSFMSTPLLFLSVFGGGEIGYC